MMRRFHLAEPVVMLATVLQWLLLSSLTGAVVGRLPMRRWRRS